VNLLPSNVFAGQRCDYAQKSKASEVYMKVLLTNTNVIIVASFLFTLSSLAFSIVRLDVEWFQASGAVVTIGGVLLAARQIIRLGIQEFIRDEQAIDGGHFKPTPEEIESQNQFEKDIYSYKWSIVLLMIGTLVWAYGGIVLRLCGVKA